MGEPGPQARAFAEFLASTGQTLWQILPTGPVGYGWSPYSSLSAFAGNHLVISFDELIADGLLTKAQLRRFPEFDLHRIDFEAVIPAREKILFRVADKFETTAEFTTFCVTENAWLDEYALFMAIREKQKFREWNNWPEALRDRHPAALRDMAKKLAKPIRRWKVLQFLFAKQWEKFTAFLHEKNISLIGDIPIFVAGDSADVWAHRELFLLDDAGAPAVVAGVPPDYFSSTGQRWGNPLYHWALHRKTNFEWWTRRMHRALQLTDIVRIDHFRGFEGYWEIPAEEPTAMHGRWVKGPGLQFFQQLEKNLRALPDFGNKFTLDEHVIAENLGLITDDVEALRTACGFPGMQVLQFRFGDTDMHRAGYRPEGVEKNQVIYTGTHDNDTTAGWFHSLAGSEKDNVQNYLNTAGAAIHRSMSGLALRAPAKWAILPLQDVLGAGGRMNRPGITGGNWGWRFSEDMLMPEAAHWLKTTTEATGRSS